MSRPLIPSVRKGVAGLDQGRGQVVRPGSGEFFTRRHRPGDQMDVEVSFHSRAGATAEVDPDVVSSHAERGLDHLLRPLQEQGGFLGLLGTEFGERSDVAVWNHHQMSRCVRIEIQHDEGMTTPVNDEVGFDPITEDLLAEDASVAALDCLDVAHSPRSPQGFHDRGPSIAATTAACPRLS